MAVTYDHRKSPHSRSGPAEALPILLGGKLPTSMLDVGCGRGTWLKAAIDLGIEDVIGIDGVKIVADQLFFPHDCFLVRNLEQPFDLGRRFDLVICLEVGEHLSLAGGRSLVSSLIRHADRIMFGAAIPGQPGQHHINCQWPSQWQELFNAQGFACCDDVRWRIWSNSGIEPWYRQNIFEAVRDEANAGREPRIADVVHPAMLPVMNGLSLHFPEPVRSLVQNVGSGIRKMLARTTNR